MRRGRSSEEIRRSARRSARVGKKSCQGWKKEEAGKECQGWKKELPPPSPASSHRCARPFVRAHVRPRLRIRTHVRTCVRTYARAYVRTYILFALLMRVL